MERTTDRILHTLAALPKAIWMLMISVLLVVIVALFALVWLNRGNRLSLSQNSRIDITPMQIRSIENIGEWEFLAISDEEIVDTIRHGFFGDDELVRIYYGTLRLGIDLHEARPGWLKTDGDTLVAVLPPVKLLDNDFIDEARSRSFYEDGKWSQADREALCHQAYRTMKQRCLTPANIRSAQRNATLQFDNMLQAMGFKFTKIRFEADGSDKK